MSTTYASFFVAYRNGFREFGKLTHFVSDIKAMPLATKSQRVLTFSRLNTATTMQSKAKHERNDRSKTVSEVLNTVGWWEMFFSSPRKANNKKMNTYFLNYYMMRYLSVWISVLHINSLGLYERVLLCLCNISNVKTKTVLLHCWQMEKQ